MDKATFRCPKCGAGAHEHPLGMKKPKACIEEQGTACEGVLCECGDAGDPDSGSDPDAEDHGLTAGNPCANANCYHCGWGGRLPPKKKGEPAWKAKARAAGWSPQPDKREGRRD